MATVRINRAVIKVQTQAQAERLCRRVMNEVEFRAKVIAGHGPYTSGALALSITSDGPHFIPNGVRGRVGTDKRYARIVHDGAKIHWIFPKGARGAVRFGSRRAPQLKFFWRKAGKVVFMPHVPGSPGKVGISHPGQEGKKFLTDPLLAVARRYRMRIIVQDI